VHLHGPADDFPLTKEICLVKLGQFISYNARNEALSLLILVHSNTHCVGTEWIFSKPLLYN
jgi:hypothetical protein